ncbi:UDP-4-amino-4,6-dideoxy-N-acetyl-beta-L-altrosamine transaminase [Aliiglaciecola sp. 3_MG-2023]|uniref:UDP-4-amino-4, 6-dideoxy-N-acetyl-beta-L-altrosamine transaminase n=1 Tax=Aliiglaciecola sp. 3_MG-2023 TaxID=3062644 RepID=UPI0026E3AB8A|nr:UDP-4-amino-4,6-dideoxy-N-acetyl-beta-L-altrosamine transaminase [Aliiglaciecola sp. 3_MG-2023]MDO6691750.1 UDP-4-amino-4,6-dideoxy-N-acetyl-beta-L-altrosamine transaminase [Aliiglaciecola sp. 3_MG-2023]
MSKSVDNIPYGKHFVDDEDVAAVVDVLQNRFLTQGSIVPKFEKALATYTGANYATAVNSATSGLHVACLALGVANGDRVWTSPISFVASANSALYCGATIDFIDIDTETRNISVEALERKLANAESANLLPKAIVVVHFSGASCQMQEIAKLCRKYKVGIIEDAAHGLGGSYQQNKIGSCEYADLAVLSFHPVKSITSAEGGAVLTNDETLFERSKLFAKHGVTRDLEQMEGPSEGPWYYQQVALGYNYRLSDLHAALGLSQLKKLDGFINKRQMLAQRYNQMLKHLPLTLPTMNNADKSAWHVYIIELNEHKRDAIYAALVERGIGVNVHYIPIHLQPYFQKLGFSRGDFPNAENYYQNALTLPLFPSMTADEQDRVVQALNEVLA